MQCKCNIKVKNAFFCWRRKKNVSNTCLINSKLFFKAQLVIYCIIQVAIILMMLYYAVLLDKKGFFCKVESIFHDKISNRVASLYSKSYFFPQMTTTNPWLTIWRFVMPQYFVKKHDATFSSMWRYTKRGQSYKSTEKPCT